MSYKDDLFVEEPECPGCGAVEFDPNAPCQFCGEDMLGFEPEFRNKISEEGMKNLRKSGRINAYRWQMTGQINELVVKEHLHENNAQAIKLRLFCMNGCGQYLNESEIVKHFPQERMEKANTVIEQLTKLGMKGMPDFLVVTEEGHYFAEVKWKGKELKPEQNAYAQELKSLGHSVKKIETSWELKNKEIEETEL